MPRSPVRAVRLAPERMLTAHHPAEPGWRGGKLSRTRAAGRFGPLRGWMRDGDGWVKAMGADTCVLGLSVRWVGGDGVSRVTGPRRVVAVGERRVSCAERGAS